MTNPNDEINNMEKSQENYIHNNLILQSLLCVMACTMVFYNSIDELKRVRPNFVSRASKELLNQLLDDILLDGILNDDEKDSIIEDNNKRTDRARDLIDIVKRKGDEACWKFIAHLQKRDPTLHNELELSAPPPPPPSPQGMFSLFSNNTQ